MDITQAIREEIGTTETVSCPFPEAKLMRMRMIWSIEPETRRCFLFLSPENGNTVLDAFIWDRKLKDHYHRFRISPCADLSAYERLLLEEYCQYDCIKTKKDEVREVLSMYYSDFPDIENWEKNNHYYNPLRIVHRIYYMQRPGLRRMLYEAGLNWFAMELEQFSEYNWVGSTLTEIMDGTPKSLFGKMNTKHGAVMLKDYDRRNFFQKAYLWYPELFRKAWNKYQCHFFENYIWPEGSYVHAEFDNILNEENREILEGISSFKSENAYGRYLCYREIRNAMLHVFRLPCFPWKERYGLYRITEELHKYYLAEDAQQERHNRLSKNESEKGEENHDDRIHRQRVQIRKRTRTERIRTLGLQL